MPVDRWGKTVWMGWDAHQELWVAAAITLPKKARTNAFLEICELTGRDIRAVMWKARQIEGHKAREARAAGIAARVVVAVPILASAIAAPSKARLMGCK